MTEDAGEIARAHAAARTHREKAELELRLRKAMGARLREIHLILEGNSIYEVQKRSALLSSKSEEAWRLVDEERVSIATVLSLLRDAEAEAKRTGLGVDRILRDLFDEAVKKSMFRRESSGSLTLTRTRQAKEADDWQEMRENVESLVSKELRGLDPVERDEMVLDLRVELDILVRQYKARIRARSKNGLREGWNERSERRKLFEALREIGVDPPRSGQMPDMDDVKKTWRRVAADCHPDRHPGNPHMEAKFKRVNEAYQSVLAYVNSMSE